MSAETTVEYLLRIGRVSLGSSHTRLIVLRGNSGAGKSSVARQLREAYGRGVAWVSQDLIRRIILKEKDRPGGVNIGVIDQVARYSLDHGYHVILDGIFYADRYEVMLAALGRDHCGLSRFYYLDASMDETLRRHVTRPQAAEFGPDDMRQWYRPMDLLTAVCERVIPQTSTRQETISLILAETQLLQANQVCSADDTSSGRRPRIYAAKGAAQTPDDSGRRCTATGTAGRT